MSASASLVAATPMGSPPANSPASLPTFSSECTQTPTRSRSGLRRIASTATDPTPPVDQTTVRSGAVTRSPHSWGSSTLGSHDGTFEIGPRNLGRDTATEWQQRQRLAGADVGGSLVDREDPVRTLRLAQSCDGVGARDAGHRVVTVSVRRGDHRIVKQVLS